ncbi:hypothetical protein EV121DRAFT_260335 [Schizophyllum commune]
MSARGNPFLSQRVPESAQSDTTGPAALPAQVAPSSKKRKSRSEDSQDDAGRLSSRRSGRRGPPFVHLYIMMRAIAEGEFTYQEQKCLKDAEEDAEEQPSDEQIAAMTPDEREAMAAAWEQRQYEREVAFRPMARAHETFEELRKVVGIPVMDQKLQAFGSDATNDWFAELDAGACDARSHDTYKMTTLVATLVNVKISDVKSKLSEQAGAEQRAERGVQNEHTGYYICAFPHDWANLTHRTEVQQGKRNWAETFFMPLLYPEAGWDVDALRKDYTKSPQMVAAYKLLFISPSEARMSISAMGPGAPPPPKKRRLNDESSRPKRKSLAAKMNMDRVTPRTIAYTACQLHFAFTDAKDWAVVYDGFNYAQFYDFIVDFFEGPHKNAQRRENAEDILAWWNDQIFPRGHCRKQGEDTASKSAALLDAQD